MAAAWFHWQGDDLLLQVRLQPRSGREGLGEVHDGCLRIRVGAPPVEGRANRRLMELLAEACGVPRRSVTLEHGRSARIKRIRIHAPALLPGALAGARRDTA